MAIAGVAQHGARLREHVRLQIGVGRGGGAGRDRATERRGRLDRERVRRHVLGAERHRLLKGGSPRVQRLAVGTVDEIEVDVREPHADRGIERRAHGLGLVHSLERCQHAAIERLGADRQPVDAGFQERREEPSSTVSGLASTVISAASATSSSPRRCSRSIVSWAGSMVVGVPPPRNTLVTSTSAQSSATRSASAMSAAQVARLQVVEPRVGVEVAVAAAREAERDMDIETPGLVVVAHRFFSRAPLSSTRSAAMNASWGTSTRPTRRIRALPFFCCSRSLRLRVMSPP